MSDGPENHTDPRIDEASSSQDGNLQESQSAEQRGRIGIRFGLLELLLLTAAIAAWLPVIIAQRHIPRLEAEIQKMRLATRELIVTTDQKLTARTLPSIWHNISSWKYSAPSGADLELRLATEGINAINSPADYQAVPLPEGEHSIHLKVTNDSEGYHSKVFIDNDLALERHHGPDWLDSQGSSSTGDVSQESTPYPMDQVLKLKVQRFSLKHPLQKYQSLEVPNEYDHKGNYLWISPRSMVPEPPSNFFIPENAYSQDGIGHRQGIKVCRSNQKDLVGLIGIQPSLTSTLGDQRRGQYVPLGVSVRPIINDDAEPEIPEQQVNPNNSSRIGLPISLHQTVEPPTKSLSVSNNNQVSKEAIHSNGKSMRIYAHYESFASGAKPIVEILFDADHPHRVGFRPLEAADSKAIKACQFVTRFDARFFWRQIEMLPKSTGSSEPATIEPVALSQLYSDTEFSNVSQDGATGAALTWQNIPRSRLPRIESNGTDDGMIRMSLLTDVTDTSKLSFPLGLNHKWQYNGIANRQTWWLPAESEGNSNDSQILVDVRASSVFPTTTLPLPGGPAIGNVRITVPMPASEPVWFEVSAEPTANH